MSVLYRCGGCQLTGARGWNHGTVGGGGGREGRHCALWFTKYTQVALKRPTSELYFQRAEPGAFIGQLLSPGSSDLAPDWLEGEAGTQQACGASNSSMVFKLE